jgi:hypothetical protein
MLLQFGHDLRGELALRLDHERAIADEHARASLLRGRSARTALTAQPQRPGRHHPGLVIQTPVVFEFKLPVCRGFRVRFSPSPCARVCAMCVCV